MFQQLSALIRGKSNEFADSVADRNGVTILGQQIRDCAKAVADSRRAIAVAMAQNEQEKTQYTNIAERITDLEKRTILAIEQDKNDLAREAAETIAILEAEKRTSQQAQDTFNTEIARLKQVVREWETRLRELRRGQQLASATDQTHRLRKYASGPGSSALGDAEQTLHRLQLRQKQIDATAAAMEEMALSGDPSTMSERLAEAGCGAPVRSTADDVLERLSRKVKKSA